MVDGKLVQHWEGESLLQLKIFITLYYSVKFIMSLVWIKCKYMTSKIKFKCYLGEKNWQGRVARKSEKKRSSTRLTITDYKRFLWLCCWDLRSFTSQPGKTVLLFCKVEELFLWCWPQSAAVLLTDNPQFPSTTQRECFYWLPSDCLSPT